MGLLDELNEQGCYDKSNIITIIEELSDLVRQTQLEMNTKEVANNENLRQYHYGVIRGLKLAIKKLSLN